MSGLGPDDRTQLQQHVERFAARHYAAESRRRIMAGPAGYSQDVWQDMASLGLLGLAVPAAQGGAGGSFLDLQAVMRPIGRHLMMEPYLSTAVVCAPLVAVLDPGGAALDIEQVIAGRTILALAHTEPQLGYAAMTLATRARRAHGGIEITGRKSFVLDAPPAQTLLVTAQDDDGDLGIFAVPAGDARLRIRGFRTVDGRSAADIDFHAAPAVRLGTEAADVALQSAFNRAVVALGFEAVGSMEWLVDATTEHVKTRRAFGGTLAQFQVVRHRIVDMFVFAKEVEAIGESAAHALASGNGSASRLVAAAKVHTCRAVRFVAEGAVQLHGGLGVSDELLVSHHFKRLMMIEALYGNAEHHLKRYTAAVQQPDAA